MASRVASSRPIRFLAPCSRPSATPAGGAQQDQGELWPVTIQQFLKEHGISEVEAIIPDMAGVARGKLMPAEKFAEEEGMRLPESDLPADGHRRLPGRPERDEPVRHRHRAEGGPEDRAGGALGGRAHRAGDSRLLLLATAAPSPWRRATCCAGCCELYEAKGWEPVVAPELEFFLVEPNIDSDYPLKPPVGRSGRPEIGRQAYSIAAVNEFDPLFDDMYSFCEAQDIEIDTLIHEAGAAQMEINLLHGYPMSLADQAFLFKRTAREAALRHKMYATFMAKPMAKEPGSAMHLHQSIVDAKTRKNIFSKPDGSPSALFFGHIAGLQKYLPAAMSLFAPNVNSYRRISRYSSAPINVHWGYDNRTAGLRVPVSSADARRVENRVGGADANPYLAIAASLACGYLGMIEGLKPTEPDGRQRLRSGHRPAAHAGRIAAPAARVEAAGGRVRRPVRARLHRRQGGGVRDVRAGNQLLGTRAPAAQRLAPRACPPGPGCDITSAPNS